MINPMEEIVIFPNSEELFQYAARDFSERSILAVKEKDIFRVVLSGGNTPKLFFDALTNVNAYIPWEKIQFYFGDERYVSAKDEQSNYHMANEYLFSKVPVKEENIYRIPTEFKDPEDAAKEYQSLLQSKFSNKMPEFDLVYLGLGDDAHTASLMPLSDVVMECVNKSDHQTELVRSLYAETFQMYRITLTPLSINNAKNIIFLVTGASKSSAVYEVVKGKRDEPHYPAQLIHSQNGKTLWYLDEAAAGKLRSAQSC